MIGVDSGDRRAHLRAESANQRRVQTFENDDVITELSCRGRHLEADEPGPDDRDPLTAVFQPGAEGERIIERAQLEHRGMIRLAGQTPRG